MELLEKSGATVATRMRSRPNKKWMKNEEKQLLNYLMVNAQFESPSARIYYNKFLEQSGIHADWKVVRSKVRNMRMVHSKYAAQLEDKQRTRSDVLRIFPHFEEFERMFDAKKPFARSQVITKKEKSLDIDEFAEHFKINGVASYNASCTEDCSSMEQQSFDTEQTTNFPSLHFEEPLHANATTPKRHQALEDTLDEHTSTLEVKRAKLALDKKRLNFEMQIKERELQATHNNARLDIKLREKELQLKAEMFEFEKEQQRKQHELKLEQLRSEEKLKMLELEMKERIAMKDLEYKKSARLSNAYT